MKAYDTVKSIIAERDLLPKHQELRDALRDLSVAEARGLVAEGLAEHDRAAQQGETSHPWLHGSDDPGLELMLWVAQVRPDACDWLPAQLWERRIFGHGVLYRTADSATRDALLTETDATLKALVQRFPDLAARPYQWGNQDIDPAIRDQIWHLSNTREWHQLNVGLRMLAWIGDGVVQRWFHTQRAEMPAWSSFFYRSPTEYASEGGWELTAGGKRRALTFTPAYQLVEVNQESTGGMLGGARRATVARDNIEPLTVMTPHEERCRWCDRRLTTLLELDLEHVALRELGLNGRRLRIVMCEECSLWNHLYIDVDLAGGARWSDYNSGETEVEVIRGTEMNFSPPVRQLVLGPRCASITEVAARGDGWDVSQLGGMPSWVQDAEYTLCPRCHRPMTFVGQVTPEAITDRAIDGVLYGLLCPRCLCSIVTYQCT